jgi:hypothetical protein
MSMVAVGIGGAVVVAGGAVAAGAMQSDATRRANASSTSATNKYMKKAAAEAERGYGDMMASIGKLSGVQSGLSNDYLRNTSNAVSSYNRDVNNAIGGGKWEKQWVPGETVTKGKGKNKKTVEQGGRWEDVYVPDQTYTEGVQEVVDQSNQNVTDYETRSENIVKDSANQTYDYNLSRFDDFADFATRLSEENQKIRLNLARAATPMFDETRSQMALNDLQLTQGIVPASVQAEIERSAAQRGLASGVGAGSQLKNNLSMRDLGLSSYAGIQQGQQNFQNRQLQDYNTLVAGTQVGVNDVYTWMGLNVNKVIDVNNDNSWRLFQAQKVPLDYKMTGLNTTLDKRFDLATNKASFLNTAYSNIYGQESTTARTVTGLEVGAIEARTNAMLGIQGQGLTNSYNNINRTMASNLANAQLVSNTTATIGGAAMGGAMGSVGAGGGGGGGGVSGGGSGGGGYGDRAGYLAGLGSATATDSPATVRRV